jgi:hypothetical protein
MSNLKAYLASSTLQFRLIVALIFMAIGLAEALAPLPILVDKFLPDDAFYYFTTAAYFARDGVPTFDGTNVTSGFHPLWLLISAFFYLFFANGSIIALRALLILQTLFSAGSVFLLFRTIGTYLHPLALVIPTGLFLIFSAAEFVNGLETPLVLLMTASIIVFLLRRGTPQESLVTGADRITFSVLLGLLFLARTDQGFTALIYIAIAALFWLPRRSLQQWFGALLQLGIPAAVLGIGYLTYNWALTGHPMQVSGEAKTFYSAMHFANAVQVQGSEASRTACKFCVALHDDSRAGLIRYLWLWSFAWGRCTD